MTDAERVSGALRPEWYEIEVGYLLILTGRWDGRDEPFVIDIEIPGTLADVNAAAERFTREGEFNMKITSPDDLRQKLESSVAFGMQLAGAITDGEVTIDDLAEKAAVMQSEGVELEGEERIERIDQLAHKLGLTGPRSN